MKTMRIVAAIGAAMCVLGGCATLRWREPKPGEEATIAGIEMVWIPPGEFMMGSKLSAEEIASRYGRKAEGFADEHPQHKVILTQGLWMGKYEVTNAQFRRFRVDHDSGESKKGHSLNRDEQPVVNVSWEDVHLYIAWLNQKGEGAFRLPTEAEWEYACRAGAKAERYWGDDDALMGDYANVADRTAKLQFHWNWCAETTDGYAATAPVGKFKPNRFGLYDTIGNVWEWCEDRYGSYSSTTEIDPKGPISGESRVLRGGSWDSHSSFCRAAFRRWVPPPGLLCSFGFRLVCSSRIL